MKHNEDILTQYGLRRSGLAQTLDMKLISFGKDTVKGRMPWSQKASQGQGLIHGGALTALADTTAGVGTFYLAGGAPALTAELKINFFRNIKQGSVDSEAKLLHRGKNSMVWEVRLTKTGTKDLLALAIVTCIVLESGASCPMPERKAQK